MGMFAQSWFTIVKRAHSSRMHSVQLKSKYYPHVTAAAALAMVLAPLCIVLALPYLRSEAGAAGHDIVGEPVPEIPTQPLRQERPGIEPSLIASGDVPDSWSAPVNSPARTQNTRVAFLSSVDANTTPQPGLVGERPVTVQTNTVAISEPDVAETDSSSEADGTVPIPTNVAAGVVSAVTAHDQKGGATVSLDSTQATAGGPQEGDLSAEVMAGMPNSRPPSAFEATGHLSLAGTTVGAMGGTAVVPGSTPTSRHWSTLVTPPGGSGMTAGGQLPDPFAEEFGVTTSVRFEDVILQQPLENRRVSRMENLIGVTKAQGWPIVLVRSDLPDDFWWVQQMVGVRGSSFAARVNFGNENSISGSVYHLVIVFLDSPDEVRRFRIAKQFKELPEGIRRTREFTFVRR